MPKVQDGLWFCLIIAWSAVCLAGSVQADEVLDLLNGATPQNPAFRVPPQGGGPLWGYAVTANNDQSITLDFEWVTTQDLGDTRGCGGTGTGETHHHRRIVIDQNCNLTGLYMDYTKVTLKGTWCDTPPQSTAPGNYLPVTFDAVAQDLTNLCGGVGSAHSKLLSPFTAGGDAACEARSILSQSCFIQTVSQVMSPMEAVLLAHALEANGHNPLTYDVNGSGIPWWRNWAVFANRQWMAGNASNLDVLLSNPNADVAGNYVQHDTPLPPDVASADPTKIINFPPGAVYDMDACGHSSHTPATPSTSQNPAATSGNSDTVYPAPWTGGGSTGTGTGTGTNGGTSTGTGTSTNTGTGSGTGTNTSTNTGTGSNTSTGTGTGTGTNGGTSTNTSTSTDVHLDDNQFPASSLPASAGVATSTDTSTSSLPASSSNALFSQLVGSFDTFSPTSQDSFTLTVDIPWPDGETKSFTLSTVPPVNTAMGQAVAGLRLLIRSLLACFLIFAFIKRVYSDLVTY